MHKLQIANTFFEWELESEADIPLYDALHSHPVFLQLQFLPILYASSNDGILLSDPPPQPYWEKLTRTGIAAPQPFCLSDTSFNSCTEIESWGYSRIIAKWAEKQGLHYLMPDWEIVKRINSKAFSFRHCPRLCFSELLGDESSVQKWIHSFPGKKVIKSLFGLSGRGHLLVDEQMSEERLSPFLKREFACHREVVCEPWVPRLLDFSTQWFLTPQREIHYLGSTLCHNDGRGQYQMSRVGDEKTLFGNSLPFLKEHQDIVQPLLKEIATLGYFGNIGLDAMLYEGMDGQGIFLHPVVEINARKTMGWAALNFQQRYHPNEIITFRYVNTQKDVPSMEGCYLPNALHSIKGKKIRFTRNLLINCN